jgi:hypothetical protein
LAEAVQIQGSSYEAKKRHPLGVIALSWVTLGIYYLVWYYKVNKELAEMGRVRGTDELGTSPGTSLLAITLGAFIIVPPFVSIYKTSARLQAAERVTGTPEGMEPGLLFLLFLLLHPVGQYIFQSNLNKVLTQQEGAAPQPLQAPEAPPAPPSPSQQPTQQLPQEPRQ